MLDVFFEADEHLRAGDGRRPRPRDAGWLQPYLEHLVRTDPGTSIVAEDRGRLIAFGIVMVRGTDGYLSELFVVPRWQGRGIGRAVVSACLHGAPIERMATAADAVQPVSTGLYVSLGLAPRLPIYVLCGGLDPAGLPELAPGVATHPLTGEEVAELDEELLGYQRAVDHRAWVDLGRTGWTFRDASGELLGYGYTHPRGRVSPVAARDPADLPAFVGRLARSMGPVEDHRLFVPGPARAALRALLGAGMRIDGSPGIYCADHERPDFERYLPMSPSLL
jgi:GNAT superfamily N-acetyltransferase